MKKRVLLCLLLIAALLLCCTACAGQTGPSGEQPGTNAGKPDPTQPPVQTMRAVNLMAEISPKKAESAPVTPDQAAAAADFALRLFRAGNDAEKNTLLSPLSVLCALAMTANGADGETLREMEQTLGMDREQLNSFFRGYLDLLGSDAEGKLRLANSVWFTQRNGFQVDRDFLQKLAELYDADAYQAPFDESTLADVNNWVREKTDGMIPEILDQIPESVVMYLINALAFEAEWAEPYNEYQVREGTFTAWNGEKRTVSFMGSEESWYLEDEKAAGFVKPYKGGKYAFAALLPEEGVSVSDYLASADPAALLQMLSKPQPATVFVALPKFESGSDLELSRLLNGLGMKRAFDESRAEFQPLGASPDGNVFISRVLHKTYISVAEQGTRAGAVTAVEMDAEGAAEDPKQVTLDRPFLYMLIDMETGLPFFIGTMLDPA